MTKQDDAGSKPGEVRSSDGLGLSPKAGNVRVVPGDLAEAFPMAECLRLAELWTQCNLDHAPQWRSVVYLLAQEVETLRREVRYLRTYGNKDCTAMADAAMERRELETPNAKLNGGPPGPSV